LGIVRAAVVPYQAANKAADAAAGLAGSNGIAMSVLAMTGAVASRSVNAAIVDTYRELGSRVSNRSSSISQP